MKCLSRFSLVVNYPVCQIHLSHYYQICSLFSSHKIPIKICYIIRISFCNFSMAIVWNPLLCFMMLQTRFKVSKWSQNFPDFVVFLIFAEFLSCWTPVSRARLPQSLRHVENFSLFRAHVPLDTSPPSSCSTTKYVAQLKIIYQIINQQ